MKGLSNLGNSCYFNSAIQGLLQVPQLSNLFLKGDYIGQCELTLTYQDLVRRYWSADANPDPAFEKLFRLFKERWKQFDNYDQQDCQEVIVCLLESLDATMDNFIKEVFYGRTVQETVTKSGTSRKTEDFTVVSLFPTGDSNVYSLIRDYTSWTTLDNYENHLVAATRTLFEHLPRMLLFSFKMYTRKVRLHLDETLELGGATYSLCATCTHQGSVHGGHFVAYAKFQNQWFFVNDGFHAPVNGLPDDYHYVAFYKKM